MRKLTILALVAMLAVAGTAFAAVDKTFDVTANATFSNGNNPTTTNNDDSCDIGVYPAATLLLPYFEVDIAAVAGTSHTTLFTITNVSRFPQIAHITLWTDWSFPVLDFNVFLTGYDVQSINLFDIIRSGLVAPGTGPGPGTSSTNKTVSPNPQTGVSGAIPALNAATNPNFAGDAISSCSVLPGTLPAGLVAAVQTALTTGLYNPTTAVGCGSNRIGGVHANAIGYVTIDVASRCTTRLPDDVTYMATEILFDNVLIGDYQQINGNVLNGNLAQGNPMVHIRAIPEGGPAGSLPIPGITNLPYTFYDRYTGSTPQRDRRQPLPATFAARWIEGGSGGYQTDYKIWREGVTFGTQSCSTADDNSSMPVADVVRFDERENSFGFAGQDNCSPCEPGAGPELPETSRTSTADAIWPVHTTSSDIAGWMYLNLNNGGSAGYSVNGIRNNVGTGFAPLCSGTVVRASQNWTIVSMFALGKLSVDFDAASLGNGCNAAACDPVGGTNPPIGPAGGVFVCPPGIVCVGAAYTGTNTTP
ncbi:MAG TPA: hypothetical protein VNA69_12055 [Thermoanaerobaculia bacterium]|nr:hypothetical protein [Thermoanaerobaculia bacterium]